MKFAKLLVIAGVVACSGTTPTNFAGNYTVTITNQANTCNFPNWTAGNSTAGIPVSITQDGTTAQVLVEGGIGDLLAFFTGTKTMQGTVTGNTFTGEILGTKSASQQTCTYTVNTKLTATLDANNVLSGTLSYTPITNGDPACGAYNACTNNQTVSGNRM